MREIRCLTSGRGAEKTRPRSRGVWLSLHRTSTSRKSASAARRLGSHGSTHSAHAAQRCDQRPRQAAAMTPHSQPRHPRRASTANRRSAPSESAGATRALPVAPPTNQVFWKGATPTGQGKWRVILGRHTADDGVGQARRRCGCRRRLAASAAAWAVPAAARPLARTRPSRTWERRLRPNCGCPFR